ncbi:MAG: diadenylate cyclase CdaA [Myxococcota bacterium]|nr:diadenylate cyclase CdaA [Myxococcota bacterium]
MGLIQWLQGTVLWDISLRDGIDILLIWFIAYRIFKILKGTRALQSLIGLVGLAGLYALSQRVQLYAVGWLLDKFFVYIVLAVLILFQNDIRRGLARAGGGFFSGFGGGEGTQISEELVQAVFALASRRIGALVVLERDASLDELVQSGHRLDAVLSQDLLVSIFHPTSPLHDGALVVQKGRMSAAKVFLPLSLTQDIARYFGTRHRAALGLSEETDAVVLVVSEERGTVSLVHQGALTPVSDTNALREQLQSIFQPGTRSKGWSWGRA